jgi:hypothetical protein
MEKKFIIGGLRMDMILINLDITANSSGRIATAVHYWKKACQ